MDSSLLHFSLPFADASAACVPLIPLCEADFDLWLESQNASLRAQIEEASFTPKTGKALAVRGESGQIDRIVFGKIPPSDPLSYAALSDCIARAYGLHTLKTRVFHIAPLGPDEAEDAALGWALAAYAFTAYKPSAERAAPRLVWPEHADRTRVRALVAGITLTRHLINLPAADLGPQEMEEAARALAAECGASIDVVTGADLLARNFPMIHAVGKGSPRAPRLIDIRRPCAGAPRITLVGKGITFDTGGLDIKPGAAMSLMKKDMGGAAHVLGLFRSLCLLGWPLDLRVLVPTAENAVSGASFRPRDILKSRKGLTVEVLDTDAEGRLVLADALAYACEGEAPDFLLDCATLTGAARTALGFDVPALFASRDATARAIQALSLTLNDPLWQLPLWKPYARELEGDVSDLLNIGAGPAGSITAALFLEKFVAPAVDWVHLDLYAWEQAGKPGRPKGGAEMGLRTMLAYIKTRFCEPRSA